MYLQDFVIRTPDGRDLGVQTYGNPIGQAVVLLNGTPTSRLINPKLFEVIKTQNQFLVCYERPGFGDSSSKPGRNLKDATSDVEFLLAQFGADTASIVGISGGGPHALAVAHSRPDLIVRGAILCSPAPFKAFTERGLDYFADMSSKKTARIMEFFGARQEFLSYLEESRKEILGAEELYLKERFLRSETGEIMSLEFYKYSYETMKRAVRSGTVGYLQDYEAIYGEWGFEVREIEVPFDVWHGARDFDVPWQHGKWISESLPFSKLHVTQDGHLSLIANAMKRVLENLSFDQKAST